MTKPLIPFRFMPGAWGLKGQAYAEAEAAYYLQGEELDRKLATIRLAENPAALADRMLEIDVKYGKKTLYDIGRLEIEKLIPAGDERELALLKYDHQFHKIDAEAYAEGLYQIERKKIEQEPDSLAKELALLDLELRNGKIEQIEYEKAVATTNDEPWVGIKDSGFDKAQGVNGMFFELDWNEQFIEFLREHGYVGMNDEAVIEQWFGDISRGVAEQTPDIGSMPVHRRQPLNSVV